MEGTKRQYKRLSTSWGGRHITLMVSVNISLTPILHCFQSTSHSFPFPPAAEQPMHNPTVIP